MCPKIRCNRYCRKFFESELCLKKERGVPCVAAAGFDGELAAQFPCWPREAGEQGVAASCDREIKGERSSGERSSGE